MKRSTNKLSPILKIIFLQFPQDLCLMVRNQPTMRSYLNGWKTGRLLVADQDRWTTSCFRGTHLRSWSTIKISEGHPASASCINGQLIDWFSSARWSQGGKDGNAEFTDASIKGGMSLKISLKIRGVLLVNFWTKNKNWEKKFLHKYKQDNIGFF